MLNQSITGPSLLKSNTQYQTVCVRVVAWSAGVIDCVSLVVTEAAMVAEHDQRQRQQSTTVGSTRRVLVLSRQ